DWPECELLLSTARPSGSLVVPELDPWFLDRAVPMMPPMEAYDMAVPAAAPMRAMARGVGAAQPITEVVATQEQGVTAATYRPARPVAVPADGSSHRATVAVERMSAHRDYVTAPVRSAEAHLRATVVNT